MGEIAELRQDPKLEPPPGRDSGKMRRPWKSCHLCTKDKLVGGIVLADHGYKWAAHLLFKGTQQVVHGPSGPQQSSEFEHSSIPATVKKIFNLKEFLTKRDAWAGTFETVLTRTTPRTDCPVTLPEVKKMKTTEAAEDGELSDFQRDLVQLACVLNGDHTKDNIFPHGLVQGMTVAHAAGYTQEAFKIFLHEAERCRSSGAGGSYFVQLPPAAERVEEEEEEEEKKKTSRYSKWLACFACNPQP